MRRILPLVVTGIAFALGGALAEPPKVVVSIKPLHGLVAAVMDGVGQPVLLIKSGADPHEYSMKPSDAEALSNAALVVWAGPGVETFLVKPVASLAGKARIIRLDQEKTLTLLPAREGGAWEEDEDEHGDHKHGAIDGHLWMSPANADAIVRVVVRELSALDKADATKYAANGAKTRAALKALDAELRKQLAPVKAKRFIVSHDSIQYFQKHFGLAAVGAIAISPDRPPSAKRLSELRERLQKEKVACVFSEPQVPDRLAKTVVEGTTARTGVLDTDGGVDVPEGKDAYFILMRNFAKALAGCLGG
jgi:zinc transport system substrate-binding protein